MTNPGLHRAEDLAVLVEVRLKQLLSTSCPSWSERRRLFGLRRGKKCVFRGRRERKNGGKRLCEYCVASRSIRSINLVGHHSDAGPR